MLGVLQVPPLIFAIIAAPSVGVLVDRHDPRRALTLSCLILGILTMGMCWYQPWSYAAILTLRTPFEIIVSSSIVRALPAIAGEGEEITRASGLMSLTGRMGTALGILLGPFLAAVIGPYALAADAFTFLLASMAFHRLPLMGLKGAKKHESVWRQFLAGLRYLGADKKLSYVTAIYICAGIGWAAKDTLFVSYVGQQLHLSAETWSGPYATTALIGEMISATIIARGRIKTDQIPKVLTSAGALFCATLAFTAATHNTAVAFVAKLCEGVATNMIGVLAVTYVSLKAAEYMRGRMKTLMTMANRVTLSAGKAGLATLAGATTTATAFGSAATILGIGVVSAYFILAEKPFQRQ